MDRLRSDQDMVSVTFPACCLVFVLSLAGSQLGPLGQTFLTGGIYHHYNIVPPIKIIVVLMSFKPKLDSVAPQNPQNVRINLDDTVTIK